MPNYTLNFAPVSLAGETTVFVGTQPYSKEALAELRQQYRDTHVFRRRGRDDVIVDIPVMPGAKPLGNLQEEINLSETREHWPQLLSAALMRAFAGARDIIADYPVTVLGSAARGLMQHPDLPTWIERRTALQFDTRTHHLTGGRRVVGLVCESRTRNVINGTCADLLALGVPLFGRYVQVENARNDNRLVPRRNLIGRVIAIEDGVLTLDDHAEGYDRIPASEAFPESRAKAFDDIVRHILGDKAGPVLSHAEQMAEQLNTGPGRRRQMEEALGFLRDKAGLEATPGVQIRIGAMTSSRDKDFPQTKSCQNLFWCLTPVARERTSGASGG